MSFYDLSIKEMASKKNVLLVKLLSTAGTGTFYVKRRNPKKLDKKLSFNKYDKKIRKHVLFKEEKLR